MHIPKVFLVVLTKEVHVFDRWDVLPWVSGLPILWGLTSGDERPTWGGHWIQAEMRGDHCGRMGGCRSCAWVSCGGHESEKRAFLKDRGISVLT